jgi:predicted nucleic acid-binding protein
VGLIADIGPGAVAVDTAAFIYFIEDDPRFAPIVRPLFEQADRSERQLVTSALTLLEVLVVPLRAGDRQLAERYESLLTRGRGLRLVDITRAQLEAAASLRAVTDVRTPDALQLAAAITTGCKTFVTNDRRLPAVPGLRVVQLSQYAG